MTECVERKSTPKKEKKEKKDKKDRKEKSKDKDRDRERHKDKDKDRDKDKDKDKERDKKDSKRRAPASQELEVQKEQELPSLKSVEEIPTQAPVQPLVSAEVNDQSMTEIAKEPENVEKLEVIEGRGEKRASVEVLDRRRTKKSRWDRWLLNLETLLLIFKPLAFHSIEVKLIKLMPWSFSLSDKVR